ncbi:MAG: LON peptidase substrate-binding domain-containing protein [Armatimonadetes bacterium]|nr:LON peptidase substrate-binding domain-containing protein [Armatimonadota bacterium]
MSHSGSVILAALAIPDTVLFPGIYIVLHISEPDSLAQLKLASKDRGYLCAVLPSGSGALNGCAIHTTGCLAQVQEVQRCGAGFNVRLLGLARIALSLELETTAGRLVQGRLLEESSDDDALPMARLEGLLTGLAGFPISVLEALGKVAPGRWLDSVGFYLPVRARLRQALLAEFSVGRRAKLVLEILEKLETARPSPVAWSN